MNLSQPVPSLIILFLVLLVIRQTVTLADITFARMLTTPLITLCSCAVAVTGLLRCETPGAILVVTGLAFSLIADTVLMMGSEMKILRVGLVMFLTGHIMYIAAFSRGYYFTSPDLVPIVALACMLALIMVVLKRAGKMGRMAPAVIFYVFILSLMLFFAISALLKDPSIPARVRVAGALAFYVSDMILGWSLFVKTIPRSTVVVWSLYGPGQFLIALSLLC